ncbi:hypothetical protein MHYP_G00208080 [Metynnis hypsauchen]
MTPTQQPFLVVQEVGLSVNNRWQRLAPRDLSVGGEDSGLLACSLSVFWTAVKEPSWLELLSAARWHPAHILSHKSDRTLLTPDPLRRLWKTLFSVS